MIRSVFMGIGEERDGQEKALLSSCGCACKCKTDAGRSGEINSSPGGPYAEGGGGGCKCTCWCQKGMANQQRRDDTSEVSAEAG